MLGACASAPVHYYTLVAPDVQNLVPAGPDTATAIPFMLLAHAVPAEVDQPQLIVRTGAVQAAVLEGERWIAPLGDEIQVALGADLARALPGQDVTALAAGGKSVLHIQLNLRRFESSPGAYALIEAAWSLRLQGNSAQSPLTCTSTIREGVESGYDSLVRGHQRALGRLAAAIAAAARPYVAGQPARCP
jgi:uncharacterized lipoprotein YmbA